MPRQTCCFNFTKSNCGRVVKRSVRVTEKSSSQLEQQMSASERPWAPCGDLSDRVLSAQVKQPNRKALILNWPEQERRGAGQRQRQCIVGRGTLVLLKCVTPGPRGPEAFGLSHSLSRAVKPCSPTSSLPNRRLDFSKALRALNGPLRTPKVKGRASVLAAIISFPAPTEIQPVAQEPPPFPPSTW